MYIVDHSTQGYVKIRRAGGWLLLICLSLGPGFYFTGSSISRVTGVVAGQSPIEDKRKKIKRAREYRRRSPSNTLFRFGCLLFCTQFLFHYHSSLSSLSTDFIFFLKPKHQNNLKLKKRKTKQTETSVVISLKKNPQSIFGCIYTAMHYIGVLVIAPHFCWTLFSCLVFRRFTVCPGFNRVFERNFSKLITVWCHLILAL